MKKTDKTLIAESLNKKVDNLFRYNVERFKVLEARVAELENRQPRKLKNGKIITLPSGRMGGWEFEVEQTVPMSDKYTKGWADAVETMNYRETSPLPTFETPPKDVYATYIANPTTTLVTPEFVFDNTGNKIFKVTLEDISVGKVDELDPGISEY